MGAEVWSTVANTATRFGDQSVTSEVFLAPDVADWFANSVRDALATGGSCNCGRTRDRLRAPSLQFLTNEIQRVGKYVSLGVNGFRRSRWGDKRIESAENSMLAYGWLCSVT